MGHLESFWPFLFCDILAFKEPTSKALTKQEGPKFHWDASKMMLFACHYRPSFVYFFTHFLMNISLFSSFYKGFGYVWLIYKSG